MFAVRASTLYIYYILIFVNFQIFKNKKIRAHTLKNTGAGARDYITFLLNCQILTDGFLTI